MQCSTTCRIHRLGSFRNPRHSDSKCGATARLAFDRDVAAHHLAEAFTDREAQAGATVFARRGGRSLGKLLEKLAHLLRRHADAGVGDRKRDPVTAVLLSLMRIDADGAAFGELVGVAHEVQQRLAQPHLIGMHRPDGGIAMDRDWLPFLPPAARSS